jgi:hypothetical protein
MHGAKYAAKENECSNIVPMNFYVHSIFEGGMNARHTSTFALPAPFDCLSKSFMWEGSISLSAHQSNRFKDVDVYAIGPIFRFTARHSTGIPLFLLSAQFPPYQKPSQPDILFLASIRQGMVQHRLRFRSMDVLEIFRSFYIDSWNTIDSLVADWSVPDYSLSEQVCAILPGDKNPTAIDLQIVLKDSFYSLRGLENVKSRRMSGKKGFGGKTFEVSLSPGILAVPVVKFPSALGPASHSPCCFRVLDAATSTRPPWDLFVMSRSFLMALKWVLTLYVCSKRTGMEPPRPVAEPEVVQTTPIEIEVSLPAEVTDIVASQEPTRQAVQVRRSLSRGRVSCSAAECPRATFLPNGLRDSPMHIRLQGFHQSFHPRAPKHVVLPDVSYLFASQAVRVLDRRLCERQLDVVSRMIASDDLSGDPLPTTADLMGAFLRQRSEVDFGEFFHFPDFPDFDAALFLHPPPPQTPFLTAIMAVVERINSSGTRTCYIEDENSVLLAFLVASLLLNGLRSGLMSAMRDFEALLPGFDRIVAAACAETDPNSQASLIAVRLLNEHVVVQFLRKVRKHDAWVRRFYWKGAQIASDIVVETAMTLLNSTISRIEFSLAEKKDIVAIAQTQMVERFVVVPAFAFLELDDITADDELAAAVGRQLLYGMKKKKLKSFSRQAPQFNFILAVAARHYDVESEALARFIAQTKKVAEEGTGGILKKQTHLELWIAEGIRQRCLATWLLFLIVATPIVNKWYMYDATLRDPFRANHFVRAVYRTLKKAT